MLKSSFLWVSKFVFSAGDQVGTPYQRLLTRRLILPTITFSDRRTKPSGEPNKALLLCNHRQLGFQGRGKPRHRGSTLCQPDVTVEKGAWGEPGYYQTTKSHMAPNNHTDWCQQSPGLDNGKADLEYWFRKINTTQWTMSTEKSRSIRWNKEWIRFQLAAELSGGKVLWSVPRNLLGSMSAKYYPADSLLSKNKSGACALVSGSHHSKGVCFACIVLLNMSFLWNGGTLTLNTVAPQGLIKLCLARPFNMYLLKQGFHATGDREAHKARGRPIWGVLILLHIPNSPLCCLSQELLPVAAFQEEREARQTKEMVESLD